MAMVDEAPLRPDLEKAVADLRREHGDTVSRFEAAHTSWMETYPDRCQTSLQSWLVRFLRARSMKLEAAAQMIDEYLLWWEDYNRENVVQPLPPFIKVTGFDLPEPVGTPRSEEMEQVIQKVLGGYSYTVHKAAKNGTPVVIERTGRFKVRTIMNAGTTDELMLMHIHVMELSSHVLKAASLKAGKPIRAQTVIFDLAGLGMSHFYMPGIQFFSGMIAGDQKLYPEQLGALFIVNVPRIFNMFWKLIKPFIDARTLEKIHICGSDYQQVLLDHIDHASLPTFLGGTCDCPGGCCPVGNVDSEDSNVVDANIKAGGAFSHSVQVEGNKTSVGIEFWTSGGDVGFQAEFHPDDGGQTVVLFEHERVSSDKERVVESLVAPSAGQIVLNWDNKFSWMHGKKLHFILQSQDDMTKDR